MSKTITSSQPVGWVEPFAKPITLLNILQPYEEELAPGNEVASGAHSRDPLARNDGPINFPRHFRSDAKT